MVKKVFIALLFIFVLVNPLSAHITNKSQHVMEGINAKRIEMNLIPLDLNDNLCHLAQKLAEDSERIYPKIISGSLYSSPTYKEFIQDFERYEANTVTYNDVLVEGAEGDKSLLTLNEEYLINSFTQQDSNNISGASLNPELRYGCVGVSTGQFGYKPFAYFIGGAKKEPLIESNINFFQTLLDSILSLFN